MEQLIPCCKCGKIPTVTEEVGSIFYVKCSCGKWSPYEALGSTRKGAIIHWNDLNRTLTRKGNPKNEV